MQSGVAGWRHVQSNSIGIDQNLTANILEQRRQTKDFLKHAALKDFCPLSSIGFFYINKTQWTDIGTRPNGKPIHSVKMFGSVH